MRKSALTFLSLAFIAFTGMAFNIIQPSAKSCPGAQENMNIVLMGSSGPCSPDLMEWESLEFDFGTIKQGQPVNHTFRFKNNSSEAMIITSVKPACGCTATDYPKEPVQPGEWATIKATFNAKSLGRFRKSIAVNTDVAYAEATLFITGEVVN